MQNGVFKKKLKEAEDLAKAGKYEEALQLLDDLPKHDPEQVWVLEARAFVHGHQGDAAAAVSSWTGAIALRDKEPHFFFMRGIELIKLGEFSRSLADFTKVISLCDLYHSDYYRSAAHLCRADAFLRLKKFDAARHDCMHVPEAEKLWTDRLITRKSILQACTRGNT